MPQSSVDSVVANNVRLALQQSGRSPRDVAEALGYAPNWLYRVVKGENGILLPTLRQLASELGVSLGSLVEESGGEPLLAIPEYDSPPVLGIPRSDTGIISWNQFSREWLEKLGIDPADCEVVRVRGTVMGLIPGDGCAVLVDRACREPEDGYVYLLETREGLAVKRIVRNESVGGWEYRTDEPEWARQCWPLTKDIAIIGEILSGVGYFRAQGS